MKLTKNRRLTMVQKTICIQKNTSFASAARDHGYINGYLDIFPIHFIVKTYDPESRPINVKILMNE